MVRHESASLIACNNVHGRKSGPMWFCSYFVLFFPFRIEQNLVFRLCWTPSQMKQMLLLFSKTVADELK